jgi:hypothetical protein
VGIVLLDSATNRFNASWIASLATTLRRTAGAWLWQERRTPIQVCRFLGHADPGFTLRSTYVGLVDEGVGDVGIFDAALGGNPRATHHPQDDAGWRGVSLARMTTEPSPFARTFRDAGGGTRTPDTRIMIPVANGSAPAIPPAVGQAVGQNRRSTHRATAQIRVQPPARSVPSGAGAA